jgi:hypothetical protein
LQRKKDNMNFKNISAVLIAGVCFLATSCKKEVNEDLLEVPAYAEFGTSNLTGKYYITNSASSAFKIPVGITNVSNTDRTIQLTYTSSTGAVAGTHYTAPTSVVIPAGKALDSLAVHGIFAAYPTGRRDTLRVAIASASDVPVNGYNNIYTLVMQKYCDVTFTTFAGDYDNTRELNATGGTIWGPYTTTVSSINVTSATTAQAVIANLYDYGGQVTAFFDWADPAAFKVTIPEQNTGAVVVSGGTPYQLWIRTNGSASTFSSCDDNITVFIDAIAKTNPGGVTVGSFDTNYRIVMRR